MQRTMIGESGKLYPDLDHERLLAAVRGTGGRIPAPSDREDEEAMPWTR
jgi:hypothetical protein